jgi:hypothetical protein
LGARGEEIATFDLADVGAFTSDPAQARAFKDELCED